MAHWTMLWGDYGLPRLAGPFDDAGTAGAWGKRWEEAGGDLRWQVLQADPADVAQPLRIIPVGADLAHPD